MCLACSLSQMPHLHVSLAHREGTVHITPDSVMAKLGLEVFTGPSSSGRCITMQLALPGLPLALYLKRPSSSCPVNYTSFL